MSRGDCSFDASFSAITREKDERIPPRERILAAAADLFYRHGIRAVGVEAIAEAAGTNKMTLYRHFASKDELVAEYLRQSAKEADPCWDRLQQRIPAIRVPNCAPGSRDGGSRRRHRRARLRARQCRSRVAGQKIIPRAA